MCYRGLAPAQNTNVSFTLNTLTADDTRLIDWAQQEQFMKPAGADEQWWPAQFARLQQWFGPTWGDYVNRLDEALEAWSGRAGTLTGDTGSLFSLSALLMAEASENADAVQGPIALPRTTDAVAADTLFSVHPALDILYTHLSSPYGWRQNPTVEFHNGIDIPLNNETPLGAVEGGEDWIAYWAGLNGPNGEGGYSVVLQNPVTGWQYKYLHLSPETRHLYEDPVDPSKLYPIVGVSPGQVIAFSGNSGEPGTPFHLHLSLLDAGGNYENPLPHVGYIPLPPEPFHVESGNGPLGADAIQVNLSIHCPAWDLQRVTVELVGLDGEVYSGPPFSRTYWVVSDPFSLLHEGNAWWSFKPILSGPDFPRRRVPSDNDPTEGGWEIRVTAYTYGGLSWSQDICYGNCTPPSPRLIIEPTNGLMTTEDGGTAQFTVRLSSALCADSLFGVSAESDDPTEGVVANPRLVFNASNWQTPQQVVVVGQDDLEEDGDIEYRVDVTPDSGSGGPYTVWLVNRDNDGKDNDGKDKNAPGITVSRASVGILCGSPASDHYFSVVLNAKPSFDVTVPITVQVDDPDVSGSTDTTELTFTPANWMTLQVVHVSGDEKKDCAEGSFKVIVGPPSSGDPNYQDTSEKVVNVFVQNCNCKCPNGKCSGGTPHFPGGPGGNGSSPSVGAFDPNEKIGPAGYGDAEYVMADGLASYEVRFENESDATAPARLITVSDTLDPNLDLGTFQLTGIAFANQSLSTPEGLDQYETTVPMNANGSDILVDVKAALDRATRVLTLTLQAIDPTTGWLPEDPLVGLLYPNDDSGRGEGSISYIVRPIAGLPSGTVIQNRAQIVFDYNDPIDTPLVHNTLDAGVPASGVQALPGVTRSLSFDVAWAGQDDPAGSGIAGYDIYVSDNGSPYTPWLTNTQETDAAFHGQAGHTYGFYSIATDNVGHREQAPSQADARTSLAYLTDPRVARVDVTPMAGAPWPVSIVVAFTEPMDIQRMIDDGSVTTVVSLVNIVTGPVALNSGNFSYDGTTQTLSLLVNGLANGNYELRMDGSQLLDQSGSPLRGGSDGTIAFRLPIFDAAQNLQADGSDIQVASYSVPTMADWNSDGKPDLIVGEETAAGQGKVRIYLNTGTPTAPVFGSFFYAQAGGADLTVLASGCLGAFPRIFDWDGDGKKDLIVGLADGTVQVFLNQNTDADPQFGTPSYVQVGEPGSKADIDVGDRATLDIVDWNNDGRYDLVMGALDGKVRVYLNEAASGPADFRAVTIVQNGATDLTVPSGRSSVAVADLNGDGRKDLLLGNTEGQLLFYANVGTDAAPVFNGYEFVEAGGSPIDLLGTPRSRPFVTDYNRDGVPDIVLGAADGLVRLYLGHADLSPVSPTTGVPGGMYTYTFHLLVNSPPVAIPGGPYLADLGQPQTLDGSGSSDPDESAGDSIVSYQWLVAGSIVLTGVTPTLTAAQVDALGLGTYAVELTVTDTFGATGTASSTLSVYDNRPFAAFTANPNPAAPAQAVTLDATGSTHGRPDRSIVSYAWDFGDGSTGSGVSVSHAYALFGSYTVVLTVTDDNVPPKTDTTSVVVTVNQGNVAPVANPGGPYLADLGLPLTLNGSGSSDPNEWAGDLIQSYQWLVGGSIALFGVSPTLTAAQVDALGLGTHSVTLTVTDTFGATGTAGSTLSIYDNQPFASFTATPNPAAPGQAVTLDASSSSHGRPDRSIVSYAWDFGDGSAGSGVTVGHAYALFGSYTAMLTVTDNNVPPKTATTSVVVTVNQGNLPPVAVPGGPYLADQGLPLTLDGSASSDPNVPAGDSIVSYQWLVAGTIVPSGVTPTLTAAQVDALGFGTFAVQLTVTDTFGATGTGSSTLSVYDNRPFATFTASPNPAAPGQAVTLDASGSTQGRPDRHIVKYEWAFGDGGTYTETAGSAADGAFDGKTTHAYVLFGSYTATLTVTDNNVPPKTATASVVVSVNQGNVPPVAVPGGPYLADLGQPLTLDGSGSSDPNASAGDSIVSYQWLVAGSLALSGPTPTLTAEQVDALGLGTYMLGLTVTDTFGATGTASSTLSIYDNRPFAAFTATPNPAAPGQAVTLDASSSTHGRPDRTIVSYAWDFGDGSTANGVTVSHAYGLFGTYTATLTVTDNNVPPRTATTSVVVNVNQGNAPPVAVADSGTTNEDSILSVSAPGVLANDTDADPGDTKVVSAVNGQTANVGSQIALDSGATAEGECRRQLRLQPQRQVRVPSGRQFSRGQLPVHRCG